MKELERKSDMYIYIYIPTQSVPTDTYSMKPQK